MDNKTVGNRTIGNKITETQTELVRILAQAVYDKIMESRNVIALAPPDKLIVITVDMEKQYPGIDIQITLTI